MDKLTAARYFLKVAETKSFSKAANVLNLPVSTVSRRIKDLEDILGVELLKRSTRFLNLTEFGETYYNEIKKAVNSFDIAEERLHEKSDKPTGIIKITSAPSFANSKLYNILNKFRKYHPQIITHVFESENLIDIDQENYNFAIRYIKQFTTNFQYHELPQEKMLLVASPEYLNSNPPIKTYKDIIKHRALIYGNRNDTRNWYIYENDAWHEIEKQPAFCCNNMLGLMSAAINGDGISLIPEWTIHDNILKNNLKLVNKNWQTSYSNNSNLKLYMTYNPSTLKLARNRVFLDFFIKHYE